MAKSFPNTGATVIDATADLPGSPSEGMMVFQKDTNELKIYDGASWISMLDTDNNPMAAWASWTPTISQGTATNISKTLSYGGYIRLGKLIICSANMGMTGAGQASNAIKITLPVAKTTVNYHEIGFGSYFVSGGVKYSFLASDDASTTVVRLQYAGRTDDQNIGAGGGFTGAVANGHSISITMIYEAA